MAKTKQTILDRKLELEKELNQIKYELSDYEIKELEKQYKEKFTCEYCRFSAVIRFSGYDWHSVCAASHCTGCHKCCVDYKPDNNATLKIKQSGNHGELARFGYISDEENEALDELDVQVLVDEPTEYTMKVLDLFLGHCKK